MSTASILINFRKSAGYSTDNYVQIEQKKWDKNVGLLTKGGAVAYLNSLLFGDVQEDLEENCGVDVDGNANSTVYAYPSPSNLSFSLNITHGKLGNPIQEIKNYTEVIQVKGIGELSLTYPTEDVISAEWITKAYDKVFNVIPAPSLDISGGKVSIDKEVVGTVIVTYKIVRFKYSVKVSQREDDTETGWSSFIFALWTGGNEVIKFNPPDDATLDGGRCGNRGQLTVEPDDDPRNPPAAEPVDLIQRKDYCSGCLLRYVGFFVYSGVGTQVWECDPNEY